MANATNALEKALTDHILGITAFAMPNPAYLALFTASPGEAGSLSSEVSAGGYSRQSLAGKMGAADASTGESVNTSAITFGPATANWGTITHCAICSAASGGTVLVYITLEVAQTISTGGNLQFATGQLALRTE